MKYRLKLNLVSTIVWYVMMCFYLYFFDASYEWNLFEVLFTYILVFGGFYLFLEIIYHLRFYRTRFQLLLLSSLLTVLFYVAQLIDRELFNYFSLFFTNILYCLMIGYSLKHKYLL